MRLPTEPIVKSSCVDGPGERTVLFTQGCSIRCPGCQSQHLWPFEGGEEVDTEKVAKVLLSLSKDHKNVTISGGEPFDQASELRSLVSKLKAAGRHVIIYTGYTWGELITRHQRLQVYRDIIDNSDVIVDGPFVKALDHDWIGFRGSSNQRPIDVQATLKDNPLDPVVLDWDDIIVITQDGDLLTPVGFGDLVKDLGPANRSRMCGQSKGHTARMEA